MILKSEQETYLYDGNHGGEHACRHCGTEFTTAELEADPGLWHIVGDFELTCDACLEGLRLDIEEAREMARDPRGDFA
jgi:hypothetical protein